MHVCSIAFPLSQVYSVIKLCCLFTCRTVAVWAIENLKCIPISSIQMTVSNSPLYCLQTASSQPKQQTQTDQFASQAHKLPKSDPTDAIIFLVPAFVRLMARFLLISRSKLAKQHAPPLAVEHVYVSFFWPRQSLWLVSGPWCGCLRVFHNLMC